MLTLGQAAREPQKDSRRVVTANKRTNLIGLIRKLRWMGLEEEAERGYRRSWCTAAPGLQTAYSRLARETD